jgi:hypothetical protein
LRQTCDGGPYDAHRGPALLRLEDANGIVLGACSGMGPPSYRPRRRTRLGRSAPARISRSHIG